MEKMGDIYIVITSRKAFFLSFEAMASISVNELKAIVVTGVTKFLITLTGIKFFCFTGISYRFTIPDAEPVARI